MGSNIHPSSIIEDGAEIGEGCQIGPFCHIGPHVKLGNNNTVHSHVVIDGHTHLGDDNEIYSFACLGKISQDMKYNREWVSYSKIGNGNQIREYVTINPSSDEGGSTTIGDDCLLLSYCHVGHDCHLGNGVIISTDSKMSGHVEIGDHAIINGKTGVKQFVRIGRYAFVGGLNRVIQDILPFCIADGFPSVVRAVNKIGLQRNGFSDEKIKIIQDAFRIIIRSGLTLDDAVQKLNEKYSGVQEVEEMINFATSSKTGLARPKIK